MPEMLLRANPNQFLVVAVDFSEGDRTVRREGVVNFDEAALLANECAESDQLHAFYVYDDKGTVVYVADTGNLLHT